MEDKFEHKLKELVPYIIITGIIFLLLPLFMGNKEGVATYLIQLGAFPLTAIGCSVHYRLFKKKKDIYVCFLAPLFYALTALLYGMWKASWYTVLIYIAAYFLCGYLGLMLTDMFRQDTKNTSTRSAFKRFSKRPRRVNVEEDEQVTTDFVAEDPAQDDRLNTSTTDDDIEAILENIHNRKS